ncbi:AIPR family protein [Leptolyngbya sp. 15MV]|nr:AIPR family protein [Leptolyngbya sp. 15MV]
MLEDQLLDEFAATLRSQAAEVLTDLDESAPLAADAALADIMLAYLEEAGAVVGHDLCPHEDRETRRPCRIIGYSLPDDSTRLDLFTATAVSPNGTLFLPARDLARLSGWAARFFEYAAKGDTSRFIGNAAAVDAAARIRDELRRIEDVRIHVLTDARVRERAVESITILGRTVETEVWDLERLYRASGDEVSRDRIEVDFKAVMGRPIACLEMKPPPAEYQTFLLVLPGNVVHDLYEQYGARLFEFNVRSFLQAKGGVNKGIRRTIEEQPDRFLAYNNGLTATADDIDVGTLHGETVIHRLKGLQIVNGAQTTASIHRAKKGDQLSLDPVAVSMKLTLVPAAKLREFVPLIARFANTQNPIQIADLSASDVFNQKLETLSETVWCPGEETRWFYERARGSYQVARIRHGTTPAKRRQFDRMLPKAQHFGKADLAKFLMTWWGEPHTVSRGAQKNYAAFMFSLRERMGEDWEPDRDFYEETIAKAIIFKVAQGVVRRAKLQSYGANVVTFMVAKLAAELGNRIDLKGIWEMQEISAEMTAMFALWAPLIHKAIVESSGKRNVTEWCKKEGCWEVIRSLNLPAPDPLPVEVAGEIPVDDGVGVTAIHADDPVMTCMDLNGEQWALVMAWAAKTPGIDEFDRKVAHTISGYAMENWQKEPSLKQAVRGARLIATARKAGALPD